MKISIHIKIFILCALFIYTQNAFAQKNKSKQTQKSKVENTQKNVTTTAKKPEATPKVKVTANKTNATQATKTIYKPKAIDSSAAVILSSKKIKQTSQKAIATDSLKQAVKVKKTKTVIDKQVSNTDSLKQAVKARKTKTVTDKKVSNIDSLTQIAKTKKVKTNIDKKNSAKVKTAVATKVKDSLQAQVLTPLDTIKPLAKEVTKPKDTVLIKLLNEQADDILALFAEEDYTQVIKLGTAYLKKNPTDTVIILKTALSNLFTNQYVKAFSVIDKAIVNKDSLVQFYATLPYIFKAAKGNKVQLQLVNHCEQINPTSLYTKYGKASFYYNIDSLAKATVIAQDLNNSMLTNADADMFGYLYPLLLEKQNLEDSAMHVLKENIQKFNSAKNLKLILYEQLKKDKQYEQAYEVANNLFTEDPNNIDYLTAKIEMSIKLGKLDEACGLLARDNANGLFEEMVYKVGCEKDFYNPKLKANTQYIYKVNRKGNLDTSVINIEPNTDNTITVSYNTSGKKPITGTINLNLIQFDTSRTLNFKFLNNATNSAEQNTSLLWLSAVCFKEIQNNAQVYIDVGNGLQLFTLIDKAYFTEDEDNNLFMERISVNNTQQKFLQTLHLYNVDTAEQLWVLDNAQNPLIVKMDGDYTLELYGINTTP